MDSSIVVAVMKRSLRFGPPKVRLADLGQQQLAEQGAVGVEAVQPVVAGRPDPAGVVEPDAVEHAGVAGGEDLAAGERPSSVDVEPADVAPPGVDDVERRSSAREREPVGTVEVVGHDGDSAPCRVDAVDVAAADLALGPVALVVAVDAVAGSVNQIEPSARSTTSLGLLSRLPSTRSASTVTEPSCSSAGDPTVAVLAADAAGPAGRRVWPLA